MDVGRLRNIPVFADMSDADLRRIATFATEDSAPEGAILAREGDALDRAERHRGGHRGGPPRRPAAGHARTRGCVRRDRRPRQEPAQRLGGRDVAAADRQAHLVVEIKRLTPETVQRLRELVAALLAAEEAGNGAVAVRRATGLAAPTVTRRALRTQRLVPHMPRLVLRWLNEEPERTARSIDGTVVFVDISGFTALSERLARNGRVGAEEITEILGQLFTRLLAVAYGNGGMLIKFGGDALLLLFEGDDHARRGARAAYGMRRELRAVGSVSSSAGSVRLRMSVGIHSGRFDVFLVGSSHRELMMTGPAVSTAVQMEGTAGAGQIVVSRATAEHLPPGSVGQPIGAGLLLRSEPPANVVQEPGPPPPPPGDLVLSCVPLAVRRSLLAGQIEPEHRPVTVAFIHFDGTDAAIVEHGIEAMAADLLSLIGQTQALADKNGVSFLSSDIDHDGGKLILVAGAPDMLGDDEERMLVTVRALLDQPLPMPVRIGVNAGHVFAGEVGPHYRRTYTVMGDTVNLAARLMASASPEASSTRPSAVARPLRHALCRGTRIGSVRASRARHDPVAGAGPSGRAGREEPRTSVLRRAPFPAASDVVGRRRLEVAARRRARAGRRAARRRSSASPGSARRRLARGAPRCARATCAGFDVTCEAVHRRRPSRGLATAPAIRCSGGRLDADAGHVTARLRAAVAAAEPGARALAAAAGDPVRRSTSRPRRRSTISTAEFRRCRQLARGRRRRSCARRSGPPDARSRSTTPIIVDAGLGRSSSRAVAPRPAPTRRGWLTLTRRDAGRSVAAHAGGRAGRPASRSTPDDDAGPGTRP